MKNNIRFLSILVLVFGSVSFSAISAQAASVSGQGTWKTTLQARDFDGNTATIEGYYDTTLDVTWLADTVGSGDFMTWVDANAWTAGLNVNGITGWRLPAVSPINGTSFNMTFSIDGTSDSGLAMTTTDGTDGGWRDSSGNPVSEMGHMYYVTLGNLELCVPGSSLPLPCPEQTGYGLSNTGPFSEIVGIGYWSGTELDSSRAWYFVFGDGSQFAPTKDALFAQWAVHSGDVGAAIVPVPAAFWLFGSGLVGLVSFAYRQKL